MAKKFYDQIIEAKFITNSDCFVQTFANDWKISDIVSWMKDTYCIDDSSLIEYSISYVKRYKLLKDGND